MTCVGWGGQEFVDRGRQGFRQEDNLKLKMYLSEMEKEGVFSFSGVNMVNS
jgi:hypothetical protein